MALLIGDVLRHAAGVVPGRLAATMGADELTFAELAEWLETLARAEKSHAGRFTSGLESVD